MVAVEQARPGLGVVEPARCALCGVDAVVVVEQARPGTRWRRCRGCSSQARPGLVVVEPARCAHSGVGAVVYLAEAGLVFARDALVVRRGLAGTHHAVMHMRGGSWVLVVWEGRQLGGCASVSCQVQLGSAMRGLGSGRQPWGRASAVRDVRGGIGRQP